MPMEFTCPHCGHSTMVADQYIGQTGPCAQCGQMITVTPPAGAPAPGRPAQSGRSGCVAALVVVGAFVLVGFILLACGSFVALPWLVRTMPSPAQRVECANNLRQIGLALLNYNYAEGHLPAAVVSDEEGRPLYSWRLSITPYLEYEHLMEIYQEDQPWNAPENAMLLDMMPFVFRCPGDVEDPAALNRQTSYVLLVGPGTPFDRPEPPALEDIAEPENTILVVELRNSGIDWLEPRDITVDELKDRLEDVMVGTGPGSNHPDGVNVLFADGTTSTIPVDELLMRLDQIDR